MIKNKHTLTILIANALASNRNVLIEMLRAQGFCHFNQASDGIESFQSLKKRSADLIISSMNMIEMNGLALLKIVSADQRLQKVPFILLTNSVNKEVIIESGRHGVSAILLEPVKSELLKEKITSILGNSEKKEENEKELLFKRVNQLIKKGSYENALLLCEELLKENEDAEVYFNIGYVKTAQELFDEALVAFRKAAMINNLHARTHKMIGVVYLKKGDKVKAQASLEKAADIFMDRNMDKEAEIALNDVLKINPDTINVYNSLGIICRKRKDFAGAIQNYQKAMKVSPDDENIMYNLGRAYIENKQVTEAKDCFNNALNIDSNFEEAKKMLTAISVGFK